MKKLFSILALSLFLASTSIAKADFATGLAAYDAGDYSLAFLEWGKAAENGDVAAQRNLGHLYRWGKGVEKNPVRAAYWYHRAAKSGFARAQYSLAILYLRGEGVPQDVVEAKRWLQKAAVQGDDSSIKKLDELSKIDLPEENNEASTQIYGMKKGDPEKEVAKQVESAQEEDKTVSIANHLPQSQAPEETYVPVRKEAYSPDDKDKHIVIEAKQTGDNVISKVTSDNTAKPKTETMPSEALTTGEHENYLIHLESYNKESDIEKGWKILSKKVPDIAPLQYVVKQATIKDKLYYRLYAQAPLEKARDICKQLKDKKLYCVIYNPEMKRTK